MDGIGESIGTMAEGGILSHAVEPETGAAGHDGSASVACANCGTIYRGQYCPECGQKAHIHRSLAAIGHDILHGVLHLDGKLSHTLPLLILKPGELTRRYIAGERAKFVSPMAMFLFSVFAMFAVFQMVGISAPVDLPTEVIDTVDAENPYKAAIQAQIVALERERDDLPPGDPRRQKIADDLYGLNLLLKEDTAEAQAADGSPASDMNLPFIEWLDEGLFAKWKKNPSLMLYKMQANGYKFSWLLIPLSLPFMWAIFAWRRQFKMYDHAVFVTYSLSFMSLLFIALSLISAVPAIAGWAGTVFVIAAPLHLYKQLRGAYGLRRFSAFWRFVVLSISIFVVLVLFLQALVLIGAF